MVSSLILLRLLRVYILKQLFFSISLNSGFGNMYFAAFAARCITSHYSPRFQRIISLNSGFGNIYLAAFAARYITSHYSPRFQRIIVEYISLYENLFENGCIYIYIYHIDTSVLLENIPLVKFIKTTSGTREVYFP